MKDPFWIHGLSEAEKDLLSRSMKLEPLPHPPTSWGHLSARTMADPCPTCGGTEYYCAHMTDQVLSRDGGDFDKVMQALSKLYEVYWQHDGDGIDELHNLMTAYNRWLG